MVKYFRTACKKQRFWAKTSYMAPPILEDRALRYWGSIFSGNGRRGEEMRRETYSSTHSEYMGRVRARGGGEIKKERRRKRERVKEREREREREREYYHEKHCLIFFLMVS